MPYPKGWSMPSIPSLERSADVSGLRLFQQALSFGRPRPMRLELLAVAVPVDDDLVTGFSQTVQGAVA